MAFSKMTVFALSLVAAAFALDPTLEEAAALVYDDQCDDGDQTCALNAVQLRASRKQQDELPGPGTKEQCCKCKSGTIGWSRTGKCEMCKGQIAKTQSVISACVKGTKTFKGKKFCANSCKSSILLEEPQAAMLQSLEERRAQLDTEAKAAAEDEAIAEDEWSIFGTTEQCCKCKSGTIGWSATGKCSFCNGQTAKTKSVSSDCTTKSKIFKGNTVCANNCKSSVLLEEHLAELQSAQESLVEDEALADGQGYGYGYGNPPTTTRGYGNSYGSSYGSSYGNPPTTTRGYGSGYGSSYGSSYR